ncbi:hypothetical protein [Streptomyces sp. NPDC060366]|uniref:hypothetical protein n=1 Tax=Streptomyces sp. NPDC060366 TaxID=3347105 RepID=UPI00365233B1
MERLGHDDPPRTRPHVTLAQLDAEYEQAVPARRFNAGGDRTFLVRLPLPDADPIRWAVGARAARPEQVVRGLGATLARTLAAANTHGVTRGPETGFQSAISRVSTSPRPLKPWCDRRESGRAQALRQKQDGASPSGAATELRSTPP